MFQPHNKQATATAIIEGLAIAKYNENQFQWEVTFLRNCGHYPKLTIREVDRQSAAVISKIKEYEIKEGDSISVTVAEPRGSADWKYITAESFDRNNPAHDPQDLRWMLDIEKLHGKKTKRKTGEIETNSLSISNGRFYTAVRTRESYRIKKIGSNKVETLGLTGRTFGADFEGAAVTVKVRGSESFSETVTHKSGSRFEMIFDNTCIGEDQPTDAATDFHFYYRLIDDRDGKVEIFPPEETATRAISVESELLSIGIASEGSSPEPGEDVPVGEPPPPPKDPEQEPKIPACQAIAEGVMPKLP